MCCLVRDGTGTQVERMAVTWFCVLSIPLLVPPCDVTSDVSPKEAWRG